MEKCKKFMMNNISRFDIETGSVLWIDCSFGLGFRCGSAHHCALTAHLIASHPSFSVILVTTLTIRVYK